MSEPLTDDELAAIEADMRSPAAYSVEAGLWLRAVAEVRRLRAENQKLKSMLGRPAQQVGRLDEQGPPCGCVYCQGHQNP